MTTKPMSEQITEQQIRDELAQVYKPEGVEIWLTAKNPMLGGARAVDLIADGRGVEVLAAVEILTTGNFA